ncbi:hypothetical protein K1T71_007911 [Dendrolimus kikuchii]|uniref:Uncharacterized protein n=1 Tax=Dendrolimus kikuchii TaxID=765133 RepID=A0ACC1CYR2_9NEOP|nr:hypothetical protein K1T71_007911 [Dendrolimus kikuchii]
MSNFKFNFHGDTKDEVNEDSIEANKGIVWLECDKVIPDQQIQQLDNIVTRAKIFTCGDIEIGHIIVSEALTNVKDAGIKNMVNLAEQEHSDLVIGKYEGGLKIWECTNDLMNYLSENQDTVKLNNKYVLDLGCGAGILGIYAFMNGASVTFQDYNKEVLEYVTIPNVLLNIDEDERSTEIKRCQFYSGDWESFDKKLDKSYVYDLILTSETIYNTNNYEKLLNIFINRLSKDGIVYVAAKTYYFGVGGSMRQFEETVKKNEGLKCQICWKNTDGIQREILQVTRT